MTSTVTSGGQFALSWVQAIASLGALGVAITLAVITWKYVKETRRMADVMESERGDRRQALSAEAAGRLVRGFLNARHLAEEGKWGYREVYWPLQLIIHEDRDLLNDHELRERVDIANQMLEEIYAMESDIGRNEYGGLKGEIHPPARQRVIDGFKAIADDLTAHRGGKPTPPTRLPKLDKVRAWMREAPVDATMTEYSERQ